MYIKKVSKRNKGSRKQYEYLHLVENIRTDNGPRQLLILMLVALERSQKWRCCPLVFRRLDKTTPCRRLFKERISHVSQYCETFINVVKIPVVREDSLCIASIGYHLKRSSNAV